MIVLLLVIALFLLLSTGAYAVMMALSPPAHVQELQRLAEKVSPDTTEEGRSQQLTDLAPIITRLLKATKLNERIQWELLRAGLPIKPSEMAVISLAAGLTMYTVSLLGTLSLLVRLLLIVLGIAGPWLYTIVRKGQRAKLLITQLPEALQLIASSLRSGFSILRGIEVAAKEMPSPISQEFRWVLDEVAVGVPMDKAFEHMTRRTESTDVKLMVTAIQIQSSVGGDLAEVLEVTSGMVRERFQLTAEIAALTAEGRLSAIILGGMPIGLALMIHVLSPDYLRPLMTEPLGIGMLIGASMLMLTGMLIIRSMLNVDV